MVNPSPESPKVHFARSLLRDLQHGEYVVVRDPSVGTYSKRVMFSGEMVHLAYCIDTGRGKFVILLTQPTWVSQCTDEMMGRIYCEVIHPRQVTFAIGERDPDA